MNTLPALFMHRYTPLTDFYLAGFWQLVTPAQMRQRPHPRLNSIAWNLWHLTRVEDAGINRFVTDGVQVLDAGNWMQHMHLPWRHHGSDMTMDEVDELNRTIDLDALQAYMQAVQVRTRAVIPTINESLLDEHITANRAHAIMVTEELAVRNGPAFAQNYTGWSIAKCLMTFALTHPYQHVGEMEVIASLLDISFD